MPIASEIRYGRDEATRCLYYAEEAAGPADFQEANKKNPSDLTQLRAGAGVMQVARATVEVGMMSLSRTPLSHVC